MPNTNNFLFTTLKIIAWIIFVGLCIEAGGLLVNFIFSIYKPEFLPNLYQKVDLTELYRESRWAFYQSYSFIVAIAILKAILFYTVILLMSKMDLNKPFTSFVSKKISTIAYYTFAIGILSYLARQTQKNLLKSNFDLSKLNEFWADSQAFILMSAVIYIIAVIFKKGIALQEENDLTV
ncbi:DUF2975 domain-containing protein [Chryseobacterium sp. MP_3.2]|uniref:DUF2975 domain-containing protein n=1 Tax=Chryseobacterium sp. MP_3.2 TaxID=3071712 RepID=UPI002E09AEEA|nr:hypothetical protein [Chryseobacterium sp. MP_3.2]